MVSSKAMDPAGESVCYLAKQNEEATEHRRWRHSRHAALLSLVGRSSE